MADQVAQAAAADAPAHRGRQEYKDVGQQRVAAALEAQRLRQDAAPEAAPAAAPEAAPAAAPVAHKGRQPFKDVGQQRAAAAAALRAQQERTTQPNRGRTAEENAEARRQEAISPSRPLIINRFANTRRNLNSNRLPPAAPPASVAGNTENINNAASVNTTERIAQGANQLTPEGSELGEENNTNQNSILAQPDEEPIDESPEEPGPILMTGQGDPSLPHILKIGQASFAEYITLKQIPIGTAGKFNALQTGSKHTELREKYGIQSDDEIAAMQRAFGVRNQHQTPPILAYIENGCVPKGFDTVRTALETRLDTLDTNIDLVRNSMAANPMQQRQRWIRDILEKTKDLTETCDDNNSGKSSEPKPVSSSGCPCLDELSLLRNLTYIISFLTGTTNPEVKQQLEQITLERMLKAVQNGNTNQASNILQDIIRILENYIKNPVQKNIPVEDTRIQAILKPVYTTLTKIREKPNTIQTVPEVITVDSIMSELNKVVDILEETRKKGAECESLEKRIDELEEELEAERTKSVAAAGTAEGSQQQILALQEGVDAFAKSLETTKTQLAQTQGDLDSAREALKTKVDEMATEVARLTEIIKGHEQTIQEKDEIISEFEASAEDTKGQTESLKEIITNLTKQKEELISAHAAAIADVQKQVDGKEAEISGLREQLAGAAAEAAEKTGQSEVVAGHLQTLTESLQKSEEEANRLREEKKALEDAITMLKSMLQDLQVKMQGHIAAGEAALRASRMREGDDEERIATLEKTISELRGELQTKEGEKTSADAELVDLRRRIEENGSKLAGLHAQIEQLTAEKAQAAEALDTEKQKSAEFEAAKAKCEEEKAALQKELGEQQTLAGSLRAELATATADGQSSKSDKEALEIQLATAMAKIASLEASLEQVTSHSAAAQIQVDEAHKAQLAALETELNATKAEVERIKHIAAEERAALIRAQEEEIAGKKGEIESLETRLQSAIETAAEKGALEAQLTTKTAELEAANAALAELRDELASRPTQGNINSRNAKLAEKDALLLEKEGKITELEGKLAKINEKYTALSGEFDSLSGEKDTLLSGLAAAEEAAEEAAASAAAEKDARLAEIQGELDHAKSVIEAQADALAEAQGSSGVTKERLNTLLGYLLINPELQQKAQEFLNGDDSAIGPIQRDLCELYEYLGSVLNLQIRKIDSSGLPKEAKLDIFNIFKSMPAYDEYKLLSELNTVFQELFVQIAQTSTIPNDLLLKKEYPELTKTFGGYAVEGGKPLKVEGRDLDKLIIELNTFGYLSSVSIEPRPGSFFILKKKGFTISQEFATANTTHTTPLVILGIKMIQLMAKLLRVKYQDLASRCGAALSADVGSREGSPVPVAEAVDEAKTEEDIVAKTKRDFDKSVKDLKFNDLINHVKRFNDELKDKQRTDDEIRRLPNKIVYSVLLSAYGHHLVFSGKLKYYQDTKFRLTAALALLDATLDYYAKKPEYSELIRRARANATA